MPVAAALLALLLAVPARADTDPLETAADSLLKADDEAVAREVVRSLARATNDRLGLPTFREGDREEVRAASVDRLLSALDATLRRWPGLDAEVEEVLVRWRWCEVVCGGVPHDLVRDRDGITRTAAKAANFQGFRVWGFLRDDPPERRMLRRLEASDAYGAASANRLARERCLPHPVTGATPSEQPIYASNAVPEEHPAAEGVTPKEVPLPGAAPTGGATAVPSLFAAPAPLATLHLSGNVFWNWQIGNGTNSLGANVRWTPFSWVFVRLTGAIRVAGPSTGPVWSWGFGYDDWHPGTFSLQVNNWGPIEPSQGLDLEHAIVNLAWKPPQLKWGPSILSSIVYLDVVWNQAPLLGGRVQFTPWPPFAISLGVGYRLGADGLLWTYGLGDYDWRPFHPTFGYFNWGPNTLPEANFVTNGLVTVGFNWAY